MIACRLDLKMLDARDGIDLLYTWMIDDTLSGRHAARQSVRNTLYPPKPQTFDPATWGFTPEAIAAQEQAMRMVGGG